MCKMRKGCQGQKASLQAVWFLYNSKHRGVPTPLYGSMVGFKRAPRQWGPHGSPTAQWGRADQILGSVPSTLPTQLPPHNSVQRGLLISSLSRWRTWAERSNFRAQAHIATHRQRPPLDSSLSGSKAQTHDQGMSYRPQLVLLLGKKNKTKPWKERASRRCRLLQRPQARGNRTPNWFPGQDLMALGPVQPWVSHV